MSHPTDQLYDVIGVSIRSSEVTCIYAAAKTKENAKAIISMAVMRCGVDGEFYAAVPTGSCREGEKWTPKTNP